jgi:hypothetical protein
MFPKDKTIDWAALTDKRLKAQRRLFEKPVAELSSEEMIAAIKAGRFDK